MPISHDLSIEYVDPRDLHQYPGNPNSGDVDAIQESMRVNGVFAPVLVQRSTRYILAGNHRYAAALALGIQRLPVIWLDVDATEAQRVNLADNRTARLGRDDPALLLELLDDLYATDRGLAGTGYDYDDYLRLLNTQRPEDVLATELEYPVERDREPAPEPVAEVRTRLPFSLLPEIDEDGAVYAVTVTRVGLGPISAADFNDLRVALGAMPLSRDEVRSYDVPAWGRST